MNQISKYFQILKSNQITVVFLNSGGVLMGVVLVRPPRGLFTSYMYLPLPDNDVHTVKQAKYTQIVPNDKRSFKNQLLFGVKTEL